MLSRYPMRSTIHVRNDLTSNGSHVVPNQIFDCHERIVVKRWSNEPLTGVSAIMGISTRHVTQPSAVGRNRVELRLLDEIGLKTADHGGRTGADCTGRHTRRIKGQIDGSGMHDGGDVAGQDVGEESAARRRSASSPRCRSPWASTRAAPSRRSSCSAAACSGARSRRTGPACSIASST